MNQFLLRLRDCLIENFFSSLNGWQRIFVLVGLISSIYFVIAFETPNEPMSLSAAVGYNLPAKNGSHNIAYVLEPDKGIRLIEVGKFEKPSDYSLFLMPDGVTVKTSDKLNLGEVIAAYEKAKIDQKSRKASAVMSAIFSDIALWLIGLTIIYLSGILIAWVRRGFKK